ncbi:MULTISPECIES: hypothetical protein [unclassified Coleofasciculus]|nr:MULTISPECIES: hypothetical protein [unclassified Coleofasciculus]MBE9147697.1 hypothetical protein [Coleofasciculus sp. LEGE 07092]
MALTSKFAIKEAIASGTLCPKDKSRLCLYHLCRVGSAGGSEVCDR